MLVLSDDELALIGRAFDRAWDKHLKTGLLTPHNLFESRRLLAARLLRSAYYGEHDEWRLARDAVAYVRQVMGLERGPLARPGPKQRDAKRHSARRRIDAKRSGEPSAGGKAAPTAAAEMSTSLPAA